MNGFYAILGLTDKAGDVMRTVDKLEKIGPEKVKGILTEDFAQVAVALGEAVDLLLRLPAALGEEHLAGLDDGRIQRGEAIKAVGLPQRCEEGLHQDLLARQQLHEARPR